MQALKPPSQEYVVSLIESTSLHLSGYHPYSGFSPPPEIFDKYSSNSFWTRRRELIHKFSRNLLVRIDRPDWQNVILDDYNNVFPDENFDQSFIDLMGFRAAKLYRSFYSYDIIWVPNDIYNAVRRLALFENWNQYKAPIGKKRESFLDFERFIDNG